MNKENYYAKQLFKSNEIYLNNYAKNPVFNILDPSYLKNPIALAIFLDSIQVFSDYFQKTLSLKYCLTKSTPLIKIGYQHFIEEIGHQFMLADARSNKIPLWDAILDATSSWFSWKMLVSSDLEKAVLVHLVLEASGDMFFNKAKDLVGQVHNTEYFAHHAEVDKDHVQMIAYSFDNISSDTYKELDEILHQGWDMLNAFCNRVSELVIEYSKNVGS